MDFACDATGRGIRILVIVDAFTRECLTLEVDTSLSSQRVTRALEQAITPGVFILDQFESPAMPRMERMNYLEPLRRNVAWRCSCQRRPMVT